MTFLSPITDPIVFLASKHTDVFFRFHPQNLGIFHQKWGFGGCPTDPNWSAKMEVSQEFYVGLLSFEATKTWVSQQGTTGSTRPGKRTNITMENHDV